MARISPEDMRQLEFEAFKALSGAEYVRQRLLHGLSMGTPSIENEAYLIKSRVKGAESLVIKVIKRRKKKPAYSPHNVRDIVGLRLLTLFRSELSYNLRRFLHFVAWAQKEPFSLFFGKSLGETVEEIKVYATSDMNEKGPDLYAAEFSLYGFERLPDGVEGKGTNGLAGVEVHRRGSEYSSIHIVLWANGPNKSTSDRVPVEVQLRTSLEDVWGEIDHRLRYKDETKEQVGTEDEDDDDTEEYSELGLDAQVMDQLRNLKKSLDLASSNADLIERLTKFNNEETVYSGSYEKNSSYDMDKLFEMNLQTSLQKRLTKAAASLSGIYNEIRALTRESTTSTIRSIIDRLGQSASEFGKILELYLAEPLDDADRDAEVRYRLLMERALCFYWKAYLLRIEQGSSMIPHNEVEYLHAIRESQALYNQVGQIDQYAADPVLAYRYANILALQGDHGYSLEKSEEAFHYLANDKSLPKNHYMRLRIPRQYALSLWLSAERTKLKSKELGEASFLSGRRQEQYLKALDVSLSLYGHVFDVAVLDENVQSVNEENKITANNILEYAMRYLRTGGSPKVLSEWISRDFFTKLLQEVVGTGLESVRSDMRADTVRQAARILGDRDLAVRAAERVKELIPRRPLIAKLPIEAYEEMRQDADDEISFGSSPVPGYPIDW